MPKELMMRCKVACVVMAMVAGLSLGCETTVTVTEQAGSVALSVEELQIITEEVCEESGSPGLILAVQQKGGEAILAAAGVADLASGQLLKADDPFFIGSMSKNLFATVTLLLVEEGKLSLDDYLADHLDWPHGETITLRMLLNHTSGIPDYFSLIYANGDRETIKFFKGQWTQGQLVERVRDLDLSFAPGTEQRYCNTNALLIGMVIEKVTGQNLAEVLQEKICIPLELYHTYLYGSVTLEQKPVPGYQGEQRWGKPVARGLVDCSYADHSLLDVGDGSIVSTAADLLTYHNALRTGGLLSDESWLQMKTQTPGFYNGLGYLLSNSKHGITEGNAGRTIGHQSAGYYHEDTDCYFVMLSNRGDGATPLGKALEKLMPKLAKEKMP